MRYGAPQNKPESNFKIMPVGMRMFVISDAKCAVSAKGDPRIRVRLKPVGDEWVGYSSVFDDLPAVGEHVPTFLDPLCYAAGVIGGFDTESEADVRLALLDKSLCVDVKHETWKGETRAKVKRYVAPEDAPASFGGGPAAAPGSSYGLPPEDDDGFGPPAPAPDPAVTDERNPPPADDADLPF